MHLILLLQASQNGNRGLYVGLTHENLLEASLKRSIFLDVFAVFIKRGCANAMQLATRQSGLEHVASVHRALGLASTHHGVDFINEDNAAAVILGQFFQNSF